MTKAELTKRVLEAWTVAHRAVVAKWKPEELRKEAAAMAELIMAEAEGNNPERPSQAISEAMGLLLRAPPPTPTRQQSRAA
jgi:hypothetical protein